MLSKGYFDTARTLLRVAHDMTNQTVADRLKAIAEDYKHRAEKARQVENDKGFHSANRCAPRQAWHESGNRGRARSRQDSGGCRR